MSKQPNTVKQVWGQFHANCIVVHGEEYENVMTQHQRGAFLSGFAAASAAAMEAIMKTDAPQEAIAAIARLCGEVHAELEEYSK